jgi:hypothetical protein
MINLIPPIAKKSIATEYWVRVVTVWLWLLTGSAFIGAVLLLPVYVLIDTQIAAYRDSANAAIQQIATFENVSLELARSTKQAQLIMGSDDQVHFSQLIYEIRSLEGQGVALSQIEISRALVGVSPILITGQADDRRSLSNFRDRLLANQNVEAVDFPISNLAKDSDIPFSMMVTIRNQTSS